MQISAVHMSGGLPHCVAKEAVEMRPISTVRSSSLTAVYLQYASFAHRRAP